ncbi:hypothetical protein EB796_023126 [Bugula neritina]|uniref:Uncharacterized protein n=1 Tax=Bugula neritina TaxID=10212 RepID=A0A7J7IXC5_BUGNE|nr:hypothetical protein EB796_023126 [Bugula neritina]
MLNCNLFIYLLFNYIKFHLFYYNILKTSLTHFTCAVLKYSYIIILYCTSEAYQGCFKYIIIKQMEFDIIE